MAEINFDPTNCPNPEVFVAEQMGLIAQALQDRLCADSKTAKDYTDSEVQATKDELIPRIESLETSVGNLIGEDTLNKLNALKALVETLDQDGDGQILDNLLEIKDLADSAQTAADSAESKAQNALDTANNAVSLANSAQTAANDAANSANNAQSKANTNESEINDLKSRVTDLETNGSSADGVRTDAEIRAIADEQVCEFSKKMMSAWSAAATSFISKLSESCPVEPVDGGSGDGAVL